jgi:LmbE family N-acetylglucosaminyl deacetylase
MHMVHLRRCILWKVFEVDMKNKKTLIIGAHADDMELSCGMFVAHLVGQDVPVKSVVVALDRPEKSVLYARWAEAIGASKILGLNAPLVLEYCIGQIDYNLLRAELKEIINNECPEARKALRCTARNRTALQVLTHFPVDVHFDHAIIGMVVNDIFQHGNVPFDLYFWKSPDSYSFVPTDNFTGDLNIKCKALRVYESQGFGNHTVEMISEYLTEYFIKVIRRQ